MGHVMPMSGVGMGPLDPSLHLIMPMGHAIVGTSIVSLEHQAVQHVMVAFRRKAMLHAMWAGLDPNTERCSVCWCCSGRHQGRSRDVR